MSFLKSKKPCQNGRKNNSYFMMNSWAKLWDITASSIFLYWEHQESTIFLFDCCEKVVQCIKVKPHQDWCSLSSSIYQGAMISWYYLDMPNFGSAFLLAIAFDTSFFSTLYVRTILILLSVSSSVVNSVVILLLPTHCEERKIMY